MHGANAAPSKLQASVAPASLLKLKSAEVALVAFAGKGEASVVSGGTVSIVQV